MDISDIKKGLVFKLDWSEEDRLILGDEKFKLLENIYYYQVNWLEYDGSSSRRAGRRLYSKQEILDKFNSKDFIKI